MPFSYKRANHRLTTFSLLLPAARADFRPEHEILLRKAAAGFTDWATLADAAEDHGVAPLFYSHARQAKLSLPNAVELQFKGLTLRHRLVYEARVKALIEIADACRAAGMDIVFLKGAALAQWIYPNPAQRAMRDMDLLTRPGQAAPLQQILQEMGYRPVEPGPGEHHHLPSLSKKVDGFTLSVEVHYQVMNPSWRVKPPQIEQWIDRARPFTIRGVQVFSLATEDMLFHLYQHAINSPLRLVSISDLISFCEQEADEIDWDEIRRTCPGLIHFFALIHPYSTLSDKLIREAGVKISKHRVAIGDDLRGWPHISIHVLPSLGFFEFMKRTLFPSDWWLYFYFGVHPDQSILPYRIFFYPLDGMRLVTRRILKELQKLLNILS
jgi:hypothetical protein